VHESPNEVQGIVLSILESLGKVERKIRSNRLLLARYCKMSDSPRLDRNSERWCWEFDYLNPMGDGPPFQTMLVAMVQPTAAAPPSQWHQTPSHFGEMGFRCSCGEASIEPCAHVAAAVTWLRQKIAAQPPEGAWKFLQGLVADGSAAAEQLIEALTKIPAGSSAAEAPERIQWRLNYHSPHRSMMGTLQVIPYLQQFRKRGGWTKGKRIYDFSEIQIDPEWSHPSDRLLMAIHQADVAKKSSELNSGLVVRETLHLLMKHPNAAFEGEEPQPLRIEQLPFVVRLDPEQDHFLPGVYLGTMPIDLESQPLAVFPIAPNLSLGLLVRPELGLVVMTELSGAMIALMREFRAAKRRRVALDHELADRMATVMTSAALRPLHLELPEVLAGPEQPLAPQIELHLAPASFGGGLEARLRIACDGVGEPPIPGQDPKVLRVNTPAGRFQLVRDLVAEEEMAQQIVARAGLDRLTSQGPFTWLAENDDAAMHLIETLEQLGDQAPAVCWPQENQQFRLVGEITPQRLKVRLAGHRDWFGVEGSAAIAGIDIPLDQLLAALRAGRRYIAVGEGQFASIEPALRQRLIAMLDLSHSDSGALQVPRVAVPVLEETLGDDIDYESDDMWKQAIERLHTIRQLEPQVPQQLDATLRDYQKLGFQWLARLSHLGVGACLADDMGLGKTVQALGALVMRQEDGPSLVVAPTSVGVNWQRETQRFAPTLQPKLYREHDRKSLIDSAGPGDLVITSYQLLQRDIHLFTSRSWNTLVLDEAQFIKNFQTKTSRAVRSLQAQWSLALSGTPLENHLGELWSLQRTICPGLLGSWERFRKVFAEPIERDRDAERLQSLARVVRPFILRRTKQEVLSELPPRTEVIRYTELSDEERLKYDATRLAALADLGNDEGPNPQQKRIRVLAWLTKLRQLACHPKLVDAQWQGDSAKLQMFLEIVDELREGDHRALVFSQFVQHLSLIRKSLDQRGISYQYLDGSTPIPDRQKAVDQFQEGAGDLFLISLKAGGTGLNLTAADYVLHLDPWWNPAVEDQATDRAHRIGQQRAVTVYRLVAKDTIEEQILALHEDKRTLISGVLEGSDRAGKLSNDELISLIRLSHAQVQSS
jgi:superfamily II DNA or RNA helicase